MFRVLGSEVQGSGVLGSEVSVKVSNLKLLLYILASNLFSLSF
jgi:hypothetical protein